MRTKILKSRMLLKIGTLAALIILIYLLNLFNKSQASFFGGHPTSDPYPNFLIIRTDDQDLLSMSIKRPNGELLMKNVDKLIAKKGAQFTNSFVTTPLCCPSRASVLTGQYTHNHEVWTNTWPDGSYSKLDHSNTLPIWLKKAGYYTSHIGKYLNGNALDNAADSKNPIPPGWDHWFTSRATNYFNYRVRTNIDMVDYGEQPDEYYNDVMAKEAYRVLKQRIQSNEPFFMMLDFLSPHNAVDNIQLGDDDQSLEDNLPKYPIPAPRHDRAFRNYTPIWPASFNEADVSDKPKIVRNLKKLTPEKIAETEIRYQKQLESLLSVDEAVGSLVNLLETSGAIDNTYVIFTSDNGYLLGEHRIVNNKNYGYEESIRVPLVMRGPEIPVGHKIDKLVTNIDLTATIVELARATPGLTLDGLSLTPLFKDSNSAWRTDFMIENPKVKFYYGVRTEDYVYLEYDYDDDGIFNEKELYNLKPDSCNAIADTDQLNNQAKNSCYANLMAALSARLAVLKNCSGSACW